VTQCTRQSRRRTCASSWSSTTRTREESHCRAETGSRIVGRTMPHVIGTERAGDQRSSGSDATLRSAPAASSCISHASSSTGAAVLTRRRTPHIAAASRASRTAAPRAQSPSRIEVVGTTIGSTVAVSGCAGAAGSAGLALTVVRTSACRTGGSAGRRASGTLTCGRADSRRAPASGTGRSGTIAERAGSASTATIAAAQTRCREAADARRRTPQTTAAVRRTTAPLRPSSTHVSNVNGLMRPPCVPARSAPPSDAARRL
jgi:hypothetical protein